VVAGRIEVGLIVLALVVGMVGFFALPARADLVGGDSVQETTFLRSDKVLSPGDGRPADGLGILEVPITLLAGQSRLLTDQLTVTSSGGSEVDQVLECLDPETFDPAAIDGRAEAHTAGTNYSPSMGQLSMRASYLFVAPFTGRFLCQVRVLLPPDGDPSYRMTAVASQALTWLAIDNFTGDTPRWWQIPVCNSAGTPDSHCQFLGADPARRPDHRRIDDTTLYGDEETWTAAPDAYKAQVFATMQITSCPPGGSSCPGWATNNQAGGVSVFQTHLEFTQLDAGGAPCRTSQTADLRYTITNDVHHFLVDYGSPLTVNVSARCGGSRTFVLHAVVSWIAGNPVKIDQGSFPGFHSATHVAVIVRSTSPATMVPDLIGADQNQVDLLLSRAHLITGTVVRTVSLKPAGTVIATNSPPNTLEPTSSLVDVTISAGGVTVPDLQSLTQAKATTKLTALGLGTKVVTSPQCTDPGLVSDQTPSAGTLIAPGSTVTITIHTGGRVHSC
jgi:hypothetical protein